MSVSINRADRDPVCEHCRVHAEYLRALSALVWLSFRSHHQLPSQLQNNLSLCFINCFSCLYLLRTVFSNIFGHSLLLAQPTFIHQQYLSSLSPLASTALLSPPPSTFIPYRSPVVINGVLYRPFSESYEPPTTPVKLNSKSQSLPAKMQGPAFGALGATFTVVRGMQAISLIAIIGMTANFIAEMVSLNQSPPHVLIGTLSVVRLSPPLP